METKRKVPVKMGSTILLLNASYEPLSMLSWKRATILVIKEKAHVVSNRTIRLKNFVKIPMARIANGKPSRALILKRDRHTCQYCDYSGPNLTLDHVIPRSRGGTDSWQNLVTSCIDCNSCKDNRTPEEWAKILNDIFHRKTTNLSPLPLSWNNLQMSMIETRVEKRGTVLATKPKAPFSRIAVSISTAEVDEWRNYIYS